MISASHNPYADNGIKFFAPGGRKLSDEVVERLEAEGVTDMGFIADQLGMFSYSGLTKDQMVALRTEHGVYGTDAGRMCVAALNSRNIEHVAKAIAAVR